MPSASFKGKKVNNKGVNRTKITLDQYSSTKNSRKIQKVSFKSLLRIISSTIVKNFHRKTQIT